MLTAKAAAIAVVCVVASFGGGIESPVLTTISNPESPSPGSTAGGGGWTGLPVLARNSQDPPVRLTVRNASARTKVRRIHRSYSILEGRG